MMPLSIVVLRKIVRMVRRVVLELVVGWIECGWCRGGGGVYGAESGVVQCDVGGGVVVLVVGLVECGWCVVRKLCGA